MKVLNKKVEECSRCDLCRYIDDDNSGTHIICGYTGKSIYKAVENGLIDKDCPFNKPITIEVIESLGFDHIGGKLLKAAQQEYFIVSFGYYYRMFYTENTKNCIIIKEYEEIPLTDWATLFDGKLNNPIELEFILNNLGIIESE